MRVGFARLFRKLYVIPQSRPDLRRSDFAHVSRILATRQIAGGPFVQRLERSFSRASGTRFAAATSSGTSALHLALLALDVGAGDEVLVPSYTCPAVAHAVMQTGAAPRFVDIDPETLNPTAALVSRRMTRRTKALIVTHTFGFPAAMDELASLDLPLLEDATMALGAMYRQRPVGSHGDIAVFSLYATKVVAAGQGGVVCTSRRDLLKTVRTLNGPDRPALAPVRYNYAMSDLTAGVALAQMNRLRSSLRRRSSIAGRYIDAVEAARLQKAAPESQPSYYRFAVRADNPAASMRRARRLGIVVDRPVAWPLHRLAGESPRAFPGTESAYRATLSVPLYPALTEREVDAVARALPEIFQ